MSKGLAFVCDQDTHGLERLARILGDGGYAVELFSAGAPLVKALQESRGGRPDLVLFDADLDGEEPLELLRQVKSVAPALPVVMTSGYGSIRHAVEAIKAGASEFLAKPVMGEELLKLADLLIERGRLVEENRSLRAEIRRRFNPDQVICRSAGFERVMQLARRVARSDSSVLILGESGVGKEVVASTIHYESDRSERRFLTVNCAALTDTLLESQLFGHVKGAFTGAVNTQRGLVEEAHQGTLFLDEIGDISPALQAKLLRVLQEREFLPVGATRVQHADVRFIAATNKDLEAAVEAGTFREDLFFRLNVIALDVPPLRERGEDVEPLANFFLRRYAKVPGQALAPATIKLLLAYPWPGNVRELENVIEMACILSEGETIRPEHLPVRVSQGKPKEFSLPQGPMTMAEVEKRYIAQVYEQTRYHKLKTAEILGISRKTLDRRLKEYAIESP